MNPNPYQPGQALPAAPRTRATRWMIWAGIAALLLAFFCLIATVVGMMWSFEAVATSTSSPEPSDLANGIGNAMFPSMAAGPLAIAGIVLLIAGFVWRQPVVDT